MNVRALTRSLPLLPPAETGFRPEGVPGDLSNHAALATLVDGADVVIHCAGAIKAKSLPDFLKVNEQGTRNLAHRSEEHTSELQSLMRISYAVFCLKKKKNDCRLNTTHYIKIETYHADSHKPGYDKPGTDSFSVDTTRDTSYKHY